MPQSSPFPARIPTAEVQAWHQPVAPFLKAAEQGAGEQAVELSLWLCSAPWPERVLLRSEPDNEEWLLDMALLDERDGVRRYAVSLPLHRASACQRYCFKLLWPGDSCWFGPEGLSKAPPERLRQFCIEVPQARPGWVAEQIFYQIFPDRFAPGKGSHQVQEGERAANGRQLHRRDWDAPVTREAASSTFYGGDLDALTSRLDYLQHLGVTALYLNPIFSAPSVHKYDTQDYFNVDPHLGGNAALMRLRQASRARGMRLVLDGVFNHSGDCCPWFDRHGSGKGDGACHSAESPYRNWYSFGPEGPLGWKGVSALPKLNFAEPALAQAIYRGEDSVVRHWLREPYAIDGWRLDVAHMLGESGSARHNLRHLDGIFRAAREENRQSYVLGEHFGDAREWLQAGVEDGAMNYMGFTQPVRAFLTGLDIANQPVRLDAAECAQWMERYRAGLSHAQQLCLFNLLDSHDTARFLTLLGEDREQMQLALGWLFCWIGVPCLYYGDEVGLAGGNDPFCRAPFPWDPASWDQALLAQTRALSHLRRENPALRRGALQLLHAQGDVLVFLRLLGDERVLVALRRRDEEDSAATIELAASPLLPLQGWQHCLGQGTLEAEDFGLMLELPAASFSVWRRG